jgi:hypothetical protein
MNAKPRKQKPAPATKKPKTAARKVLMLNPNTGQPDRNIDADRYEAVRKAILKAMPRGGDGVIFTDLFKAVPAHLPGGKIPRGGAINWYTTVVKLHMEASGEIRRVPGSKPQRLVRAAKIHGA